MLTLFLLAIALSADAFAVAVAQGARASPRSLAGEALRIGCAFGLAQGLMPIAGWSVGLAFSSFIRDIDHWIAFGLLSLIGARMAREGWKPASDLPKDGPVQRSAWALLTMAIAT